VAVKGSIETTRVCLWCGKGFTPRATGGKPQAFCRPACRRAFDASGRRWVSVAIATGVLTVDGLRNDPAATRALPKSGNRPPLLPDIGSVENEIPAPVTRFLVEVPRDTIEAFVRFGFIRPNHQDDLLAIAAALKRLGRAPTVSRIT